MMYAPRVSHDFHWGRKSTYRNLSGRPRSLISRIPVNARNTSAVIAPSIFTLSGMPIKYPPKIGRKNAPAAIAFVQIYAETSQPHSTPFPGASYTRRGLAFFFDPFDSI